jgi:hypothetical protein
MKLPAHRLDVQSPVQLPVVPSSTAQSYDSFLARRDIGFYLGSEGPILPGLKDDDLEALVADAA